MSYIDSQWTFVLLDFLLIIVSIRIDYDQQKIIECS